MYNKGAAHRNIIGVAQNRTIKFFLIFGMLIFRCAAPLRVLCCIIFYKYSGALPRHAGRHRDLMGTRDEIE